jgi:GNAT superfamily N-acetyltransferase
MKLINVRARHIPALVALWTELMQYHEAIDPIFRMSAGGREKYAAFLTGLLQQRNARVVAAADGDTLVAYAVAIVADRPPVFWRDAVGEISDFYVRPGYRRKGVGRKMLARIEAWFRGKGIDRIELRVAWGNPLGHEFWRMQGFGDYLRTLYREIPRRRR